MKGLTQQNYDYLVLSAKVFPLARPMLVVEAEALRNQVSGKSFEAYKKAVYYDPYSPEFLSVQMQLAYIFKDNNLAIESFYRLKAVSPNMPIVKEIVQRGNIR